MRRFVFVLLFVVGGCAQNSMQTVVPGSGTDAGIISGDRDASATPAMELGHPDSGSAPERCGEKPDGWAKPQAPPAPLYPTCRFEAGTTACDAIGAHCVDWMEDMRVFSSVCVVDECYTDDDCDGQHKCVCWRANRCVPADCKSGTDCPDSQVCKPSLSCYGAKYGFWNYSCTTRQDECSKDADCPGSDAFCGFDADTHHWKCMVTSCFGSPA